MNTIIFENLNFRTFFLLFFHFSKQKYFLNYQNIFIKFFHKNILKDKIIKKINFNFLHLFDSQNKHFWINIDYYELFEFAEIVLKLK